MICSSKPGRWDGPVCPIEALESRVVFRPWEQTEELERVASSEVAQLVLGKEFRLREDPPIVFEKPFVPAYPPQNVPVAAVEHPLLDLLDVV
jgi:hypothetical protein